MTTTTTTPSLRERAIEEYLIESALTQERNEAARRQVVYEQREAFQRAVMALTDTDGFGIRHIDEADGSYFIEVDDVRFGWDDWTLKVVTDCPSCGAWVLGESPRDMAHLGMILSTKQRQQCLRCRREESVQPGLTERTLSLDDRLLGLLREFVRKEIRQ